MQKLQLSKSNLRNILPETSALFAKFKQHNIDFRKKRYETISDLWHELSGVWTKFLEHVFEIKEWLKGLDMPCNESII